MPLLWSERCWEDGAESGGAAELTLSACLPVQDSRKFLEADMGEEINLVSKPLERKAALPTCQISLGGVYIKRL